MCIGITVEIYGYEKSPSCVRYRNERYNLIKLESRIENYKSGKTAVAFIRNRCFYEQNSPGTECYGTVKSTGYAGGSEKALASSLVTIYKKTPMC